MTTSIPLPSFTTFLPVKPALRVAARVDRVDFLRDVITALERAGLVSAALTLTIGTWPREVWATLCNATTQQEADEEERAVIENARDHLVALLDLYEVAFEWDASTSSVKVVGKKGEWVSTIMRAPPSLRRRLNKQIEEERGRGGEMFGDHES